MNVFENELNLNLKRKKSTFIFSCVSNRFGINKTINSLSMYIMYLKTTNNYKQKQKKKKCL